MNILKIGIIGNGQVGSFIYDSFLKDGCFNNVNMYCRKNGYDITKLTSLKEIVKNNDIIINCAAYTNVDQAEIEKEQCRKVNYDAVKKLVNLIKNTNKKLIHFSSDYVYGNNGILNRELIESDICKPCNYYGKTKLLADKYIIKNLKSNYLILRPSWVFGPNGNNFIDKIINKLNETHELKIVNDQYGVITSTYLIYKVVKLYVNKSLKDGLYNISCDKCPDFEKPSRFSICSKIIDFLKLKRIKLEPCKSDEFKTLAKRQTNSLLNCEKLDKEIQKHSHISRTSWDIELSNYIYMYIINKGKIKNV